MSMMANDILLPSSKPSLKNRVLLRAKNNESMILVEGWDDREFVKDVIGTKEAHFIQVCDGKENVVSFLNAVKDTTESTAFALVDIDYDWAKNEPPNYLENEHIFHYPAHSLESFKFFFENDIFISNLDQTGNISFAIKCAVILGRLRAWNSWRDLGKSFENNRDNVKSAFNNAFPSRDHNLFLARLLEIFELGPKFYSNTLANHLNSAQMNDSFIIHGKDLHKFFIYMQYGGSFRLISNHELSLRVRNSPMYNQFLEANLTSAENGN
jgi:hypothetical protein